MPIPYSTVTGGLDEGGTLGQQTFLTRLWALLSGAHSSAPPRDVPLVTSLCYYSLTFIIGRLVRHAFGRAAPLRLRPYLLDFITTFQMMACSLENMHIRTHYGYGGYVAIMFTVAMWYSLTVKEGKSNPCCYVVVYMQGKTSRLDLVLRFLIQTCGALLSYKYARLFWSLGISEVHRTRYGTLHCTTDLQVPLGIGFGVEFGGTLLDCLLSLTMFTSFDLCEMATKCLLGCFLTVFGLNLTGFYLNPVNATNQTFGCHGASFVEFLLVYWVGPISATVVGVTVHCALRDLSKAVVAARVSEDQQCEVCGKIHGAIVGPGKESSKVISGYLAGGFSNSASRNDIPDIPRATSVKIMPETKTFPRKRK